jgi:hypothetical protein
VSQSTLSKLENGKPFDLLEIGFYMKVYGISSEKLFMKLHANGALSEEELSAQQPVADEYPLFATATCEKLAEVIPGRFTTNVHAPSGYIVMQKKA